MTTLAPAPPACNSGKDLSHGTIRKEAADRIRSLLDVTDDECISASTLNSRNEHKARRIRIYNAQKSGQSCAKCERQLAPEEPIWRERLGLGYGPFGHWHTRIAPVCEQCKSSYRRFPAPHPCEGCGRPVHNERKTFNRRHSFCSEDCQSAACAAVARDRRRQSRGVMRSCEHCGETFEPTRADSKFCSVACKQREYRRRVTDNKRLAGERFESRNGEAA